MGQIYGELRELTGEATLSWDIAHHLYARHLQGVALIITDKPTNMLASVRKQWVKVCGRLLKERAKTLKPERISEINYELQNMKKLRFVAKQPPGLPDADVYLVAPEWVDEIPVSFTVYVTCPVDRATLHKLVAGLPYHALIVVYDTATADLLIEDDKAAA